MNRRNFLCTLAGVGATFGLGIASVRAAAAESKPKVSKLMKSKDEWKKLLSREQYQVLFEEDTERSGTSPLNGEKRPGLFLCAACYLPLFDARHKFESGTGWPSFFDILPGRIATRTDYKLIWPRTEYHCARCESHQGHVFNDGPAPTGLRYCNNGVALRFVAAGEPLPELRI